MQSMSLIHDLPLFHGKATSPYMQRRENSAGVLKHGKTTTKPCGSVADNMEMTERPSGDYGNVQNRSTAELRSGVSSSFPNGQTDFEDCVPPPITEDQVDYNSRSPLRHPLTPPYPPYPLHRLSTSVGGNNGRQMTYTRRYQPCSLILSRLSCLFITIR